MNDYIEISTFILTIETFNQKRSSGFITFKTKTSVQDLKHPKSRVDISDGSKFNGFGSQYSFNINLN